MSSSATVTVLFCDVVGSTERLVRLGDIAADEDRRTLFTALSGAVEQNDGQVVKHLGDGLMIVFEHSAVRALSCARDLHTAAGAIDPEDPIRLRVGISAGEVAREQGDWFGLPVVEAARLCNAAAPGQTLANAVVRYLVGSRAGEHRITEIGALPLKGLATPLSTVDVAWQDGRPYFDLFLDGFSVGRE
ncbi:MAG: adenylate/guanylate cyclase domain-containing protein [Actinomycetota bacterium]|nr:adenylate/guanylate cyclase domain-containing protein [Actinomycetota bacterium]